HHLDAAAKRDLFRRVREVVVAGGVFVLADVVVPERAEDAVTPLTPGFDLPDRATDQLAWLKEAGFAAEIVWERGDLAVLSAKTLGAGFRNALERVDRSVQTDARAKPARPDGRRRRVGTLGAGGDEDEVRPEAERKAEQHPAGDDRLVHEHAADVHQLAD